MSWARDDVRTENTPLSTTGGHTWAAAYRLADFLYAMSGQLGLERSGVRILELGSGCGWLGMTLAHNLPSAALVCLTEQEGGVGWLRHNVELNRQRGLPLANLHACACDWLEFAADAGCAAQQSSSSSSSASGQDSGGIEQTAAGTIAAAAEQGEGTHAVDLRAICWDFIIGSDLIYNEVGSRCLPRVLAALARPTTQILYCHTKHRYDLLDMEFLEELSKVGLTCEEVWEPGTPPPPKSPPLTFPPDNLFPDQRIAVFRIGIA